MGKGLEYLRRQLELSNKVIEQFTGQVENLELTLEGLIDSAPKESRSKMKEVKTMTNLIIERAKKGDSSYEELISKMKEKYTK